MEMFCGPACSGVERNVLFELLPTLWHGTLSFPSFQQEAQYKGRRHEVAGAASFPRRPGQAFAAYRPPEPPYPGYSPAYPAGSEAALYHGQADSSHYPAPSEGRSYPSSGHYPQLQAEGGPPYSEPAAFANSYPPSAAKPGFGPGAGPYPPPGGRAREPSPSRSPPPESGPAGESLPCARHPSSLDSRIEMLLKGQRSGLSFLRAASEEEVDEEEEEEEGGARGEGEEGPEGAGKEAVP
ncbi:hypothetical protein chiPu_0029725, partial [Chiloscyllium punctatum]|nr:hypothetical protein [Chiloscyllium punctatum]